MKKILIIEDNPRHLQDAKEYFRNLKDSEFSFIFKESYCSIGHRAEDINVSEYQGVISDIYFPYQPGDEVQPIGVSVMFQAVTLGIPFIFCTDGHHHGSRYQWINNMCAELREAGVCEFPWMIDSLRGSNKLSKEGLDGARVATKGWAKAWDEIKGRLCEC